MSRGPINANCDISEEHLKKIEALYKQKNRFEQKKSMQKRGGSIKLRNLHRQSGNLSKEQLNLVQTLAIYFENVVKSFELIDDFCEKRKIYFLNDLKRKITYEQYKSFLTNLQLYKVPQGCKLQQQGKFHNFHYIVVDGCIGAFQQKKLKDDEKQYAQKFQYEIGEAIISNLLQTHKSNPYTNKAKRLSILLRFSDDIFNKYLKRLYIRDCDQNASILSHTLVFRGIPLPELKKFIPYCNIQRFRYNEIIYEEEDPIKQLFLILEGEVEIGYEREELPNKNKQSKTNLAPLVTPNHYKLNYQTNDKKEFKIVKVGNKQLFGLEAYQVFNQNCYEHHAKATSDQLKVLAIGLDVLYQIDLQNPILQQNLNSYLKKIKAIHSKLLLKNQNLAIAPPQKKKKRKRKIKRKTQVSLEWWGLAAKIQDTKKYKLPTPPKNISEKNLRRKQPLDFVQRTSKLQYFKKRLFQDQIEELQQIQQKQNNQLSHSTGLIPKLHKVKIKMINSKPKVINNAERVKKKLLEYAKNKDIFCDKLQLQ